MHIMRCKTSTSASQVPNSTTSCSTAARKPPTHSRGACHASARQASVSTDAIAVKVTEATTYLKPPKPVPVIHSSAYLRARQAASDPSESAELESTSASGSYSQDPGDLDSFSGNALEWALRKVDASLDEIEHNPPAYQKAIYDFTKSPAGVAAAKGVKTAANVTVTATVEAAKIAAPVGKWALAEGFKAAVGLVSYAKQQQQEQERKQKQLGKGKGK